MQKRSSLSELIWFILISTAIIVPIRLFIVQPFIVNGISMYPTFNTKDYLIVDEISYKLGKEPERGDIIVFKKKNDNSSKFLIKRIIGLPNETIKIENNNITIINEEHPQGFTLEEPYIQNQNSIDTTIQTKENEYVVLGDNRPASSDSRYWGPITKDQIIGRALIRLFPLKKATFNPGDYNFPA